MYDVEKMFFNYQRLANSTLKIADLETEASGLNKKTLELEFVANQMSVLLL